MRRSARTRARRNSRQRRRWRRWRRRKRRRRRNRRRMCRPSPKLTERIGRKLSDCHLALTTSEDDTTVDATVDVSSSFSFRHQFFLDINFLARLFVIYRYLCRNFVTLFFDLFIIFSSSSSSPFYCLFVIVVIFIPSFRLFL